MSGVLTQGLGPGGEGGSEFRFIMRAYHTVSPIGYVYWSVDGVPDGSGDEAPYPPGELNDIVIARAFIPEN